MLSYHVTVLRDVNIVERRQVQAVDRRRFPRGGRREGDQPGKHPTVAIIERYYAVRRPCARYLTHYNFDVVEAAGFDEGVALVARTRPALILVEGEKSADYARLQDQARLLGIPVVSMSTALAEESRKTSDSDGLLLKPFSLNKMVEEIRRVIRAVARAAAEQAAT